VRHTADQPMPEITGDRHGQVLRDERSDMRQSIVAMGFYPSAPKGGGSLG
jgi:hypothetical protein